METVDSVRIDQEPVQTETMPNSQQQPPTHRPNHNQQSELSKPSRSPLANAARYPYPIVNQVSNQRYNNPRPAPYPSLDYRDYRQHRLSLSQLCGRNQMHRGSLIETIPGQGQQPLRIDMREQSGVYNPQVEAISPTLPDYIQQEDQAFRSTKDELLQQIAKADQEIVKAEAQLGILKKKRQELVELALKSLSKPETQQDTQPKRDAGDAF